MDIPPLTPYEIATGFPLGPGALPSRPRVAPWRGRGNVATALSAFEDAVRAALVRPPCVVHFSGGRDSSAVLAVAASVARRDGLELPVPLTLRFPGQPETDEAPWQQLVIRHLKLREWARMDAAESSDLVGPQAQKVLRRHGVIWSPVLATRPPTMVLAAGGTLLTGEGGDEVLGRRRAAALLSLGKAGGLRAGTGPARKVLGELLPRRQRQARWRERLRQSLGLQWLQPDVREDFLARSGAMWASEPFEWPRALQWVTSLRHVSLGLANMTALGTEMSAMVKAPFLSPGFVSALGGAFGSLGPDSRTTAMRALFSTVLPDELLARPTKAVFTLPAWGPCTRELVASWSGDGADPDLVDLDALRRHWAGPRPSALTFALVQSVWLAQEFPARLPRNH